jgi:putative hemolysin
MGSVWISKALNGVKKMTGNFNIGKSGFKLAWICIVVLLSTCSLNVMGQVVDTSGPDRAYCVGTGNLYATTPGVNNNRPICKFTDNTWCDAHSFFAGNCTGNSRPSYTKYASYTTPLSALDLADVTKTCQTRGGQVQNVHTPYGDVNLCVFPDGSSVDLRSLSSAVYRNGINGMPDNGIYYTPDNGIYNTPYNNGLNPVVSNGLYDANAWYYGAYAFLNSP